MEVEGWEAAEVDEKKQNGRRPDVSESKEKDKEEIDIKVT